MIEHRKEKSARKNSTGTPGPSPYKTPLSEINPHRTGKWEWKKKQLKKINLKRKSWTRIRK
jgi:hypothetical protein